ncbi:MAG: carboxymuconolactone decarboxylase family protein [Sandaracinaceae bacterium]
MIRTNRVNAYDVAPDAMAGLLRVEKYLARSGLERSLVELVKMRASQINGCAFCLELHSREARAAGESERRLYLLDAWAESSLYSERERAALAWAEALTKIWDNHAPDALFERVRSQFSEKELADLTTLVALINAWNRLAIALRYEHSDPLEGRRLTEAGLEPACP